MQSNTSASGPDFVAYTVEEPRTEGGKARWHRVGACFSNRSGNGYTLVIPPGVSISGRVQLIPPRDGDRD